MLVGVTADSVVLRPFVDMVPVVVAGNAAVVVVIVSVADIYIHINMITACLHIWHNGR